MSLLLTLGLGSSGTPPTPPTGGDTPYMNLLLPTVSVTLGPLYATEVNQAFLRVDSHDHSDGFGKLVGTNGLNINANLPFHGFQATNLDAAGFNIRSHTSGLTGSIYFSGQDFYVVDGTGFAIQITAANAVNVSGLGGWTGLTAPAQASYSSVTKKFALQSNTTGPVYGLLQVGDIILFPGDPNLGTLPSIRLATPNSGVSTYTWQFPPAVPAVVGSRQVLQLNHDGTVTLGPTLPSVTSFMRIDPTGVLQPDVTLDAATLQLSGSGPYVMRVSPLGIGTTQLQTGAVTQIKQGPVATSSGFSASGAASGGGLHTIVDSVGIVALGVPSGRPVVVGVWPYGTAAGLLNIHPLGGPPGPGLVSADFELVRVDSPSFTVCKWTVQYLDDGSGTMVYTVPTPTFIPVLTGLLIGSNTFRLRVSGITTGYEVGWANLAIFCTQL